MVCHHMGLALLRVEGYTGSSALLFAKREDVIGKLTRSLMLQNGRLG